MSRCLVSGLTLLTALVCAPLAGREVAITIDDLPRGGDGRHDADAVRQMTVKLLEPFRSARIPVTGFVNECKLPGRLREILSLWIAAGADLGNHTCSHPDLNTASIEVYEDDIQKGEAVTTSVLGRRPRYFRHPFLHAGNDAKKKQAIHAFLEQHGYRVAPVTLDNSDYMFALIYARALERGDTRMVEAVREAYLPYMESIFEFFEKRSIEVTGHEIRQVLLIHANQLNADMMTQLIAMMRRRGYSFVTLDRALEDPAYSLPEDYVGPGGFSWIHRWSKTKGMSPKGEPDEPGWVRETFRRATAEPYSGH
jgi:peptidoglycan/xylan/chitin deacetylase (PgdA/CDA1 family)